MISPLMAGARANARAVLPAAVGPITITIFEVTRAILRVRDEAARFCRNTFAHVSTLTFRVLAGLLIRTCAAALQHEMARNVNILVQDGRIAAVGPHIDPPSGVRMLDARRLTALPGFIDVHVHGSCGVDSMQAEPAAYDTLSRFYAAHGVTGFLATTVTDNPAGTRNAVNALAGYATGPQPGAQALGIHLEGPYLNAKWCGAQNTQHIRPADADEYNAWFATGKIRMITLAPEAHAANEALLDVAVQRGCAVALGHTDSTYAQGMAYFARGANQTTHTFNAMRGLQHREPGLVGAVMDAPEAFAQLICDTVHVHPAAMRQLYRAKGPGRLIAITDAIAAAAMPDGNYEFGGQAVRVLDGVARIANGALAGSTLTMDAGFRNLLRVTGCALHEAAHMCSHTPAASIGLGERKGRIAPGYDADLVLLDAGLNVVQTLVAGEVVFAA
jgi:N-acetylglucosamine-6-phosphate deacetylase